MKEFYTQQEFADLMCISYRTVSRWLSSGKIKAIKSGDAKNSRTIIPRLEVEKLLQESGIVPDQEQ